MRALVRSADETWLVDLDEETVLSLGTGADFEATVAPPLSLPRVVAASASGSTVVAVVDAQPPLMVSHDAGRTWRQAGRGLPAGRAVAIDEENPDLVLYATASRLYLSRDGGRFWRALTVELAEIEAVAWA